jgi:ATP-dependent DNA ligase
LPVATAGVVSTGEDFASVLHAVAAHVERARVHEIKHDGYRLIVRRDGKAVQLFTRRGYD